MDETSNDLGAARTSLERATREDAPLLEQLLELYIHDLSDVFPNLEVGADGRFGYAKLAQYWAEPERRFAFLIRKGERISGFALATRGSPAAEDPNVLDVAEFFVLRAHRRFGVGRQAAMLLWKTLPGTWTVRVSQANRGGLAFWSRTVAEYAGGAAKEFERPGAPNPWRVYSFETQPEANDGRGAGSSAKTYRE